MTSVHIDVSGVAHLARLALTPEETATLGGQLDQILAYVAKLNELDITNVEPTAHAVPLANVVRPDVSRPSLTPEEVLRNAPARSEGLFLVPKIVE